MSLKLARPSIVKQRTAGNDYSTRHRSTWPETVHRNLARVATSSEGRANSSPQTFDGCLRLVRSDELSLGRYCWLFSSCRISVGSQAVAVCISSVTARVSGSEGLQ